MKCFVGMTASATSTDGSNGRIERLPCQRHLFSLPDDGSVYLNCASRSPMLKEVELIGHKAVSQKNEPWRISDDGVHERVRTLFARLLDVESDNVALTPSTSYAISMAARNILDGGLIKAGDSVLVLENQMSSNVYPWQWLCRKAGARLSAVVCPLDGLWTGAVETQISEIEASGSHVAVIAVPNFLWTDGSGPLDLARIGARCHARHGDSDKRRRTQLVVDATQSLGAVPLDVRKCHIDWLACSVHKWLFGPYGLSLVYASDEWCRDSRSEPLVFDEHNRDGADGDKVLPFDISAPGYSEAFQPGARRFDAGGRPNPILLPMVEAALTQILQWRPERIMATVLPLVQRVVAGAKSLGLTVPQYHAPHIVGVGAGLEVVGEVARSEWSEDASAHLKKRGIFVSSRVGVLRVAPNVYNTSGDVDALIEGLRDFLSSRSPDRTAAPSAAL